jgi:hypothetical protein
MTSSACGGKIIENDPSFEGYSPVVQWMNICDLTSMAIYGRLCKDDTTSGIYNESTGVGVQQEDSGPRPSLTIVLPKVSEPITLHGCGVYWGKHYSSYREIVVSMVKHYESSGNTCKIV